MKVFVALFFVASVALAQECPLTSRLAEDWVEYTEEAEELGWYEDGFVQIDQVSLNLHREFTFLKKKNVSHTY